MIFLLELAGCTVVPLPVALILVAFVSAAPRKWVRFALGATGGSILGSLGLYIIGRLFFHSLGEPLMTFYGAEAHWAGVIDGFHGEWGFGFVLLAGVTTGLFRLASLGAGFAGMNPVLFIGLISISRFVRFLSECGAIKYLGQNIKTWRKPQAKYVTVGAFVLIFATILIVTLVV